MSYLNLGVIGWPINHSLSPVMHNAALKHLNIPGEYNAIGIEPHNLEKIINEKCKRQLDGWNVTVPHKDGIINLLDKVDPICLNLQSVNTVVKLKTGEFWGTSTDGYGLSEAIKQEFNIQTLEDMHVILVGAGGASRAAAGYLAQDQKISKLTIINRTISKAIDLQNFIKKIAPKCQTEILETNNISNQLPSGDLIIQGTSLGLNKEDSNPFPAHLIPSKCLVFDMIYHQTKFLEDAKNLGLKTANGIDMLLYQGAKSFEYWTNQAAPIKIMKDALSKARSQNE